VVPAKRNIHAVRRNLKLVADLGIPVDGPLEFPLPDGAKPAGFNLKKPFLLVHPFSRGRNKSLTQAVLEQICGLIQPVPVVLVGRSELRPELPPNCVNLLNRTSISGLIWLIRHARFTLSVDSGPMHIAAAITGRLLGIHNWTDPRIVGPFNPEAWVWKNGALIQVKSLDTTAASDKQRNFSSDHLPAVVDFLKARL
jgi:ADP-heptose:LPS heptosyltransferase